MAHQTHLHVDDLPSRIKQDSQTTTLEKPTLSHTSPSSPIPNFGKNNKIYRDKIMPLSKMVEMTKCL